MTVVITGATGNVGGNVVAGLLERGVPVRVTSRDPGGAVFPAGVEVARADLTEPESLRAALVGAERVFLYPRTQDPDALVAVLPEAGVEHVVLLSASSAAEEEDAEDDFNRGGYLRGIERRLAASGLTYTFLRPDTFASNASVWRDTIKDSGTVPLPYPDSVQVPIHEKDIADVAVVALTTDRLNNAAPVLTGPERITLREQVAAIGAAIGRELTVVEQTEAEAREFFAPFRPPRFVDGVLSALRASVGATPEISPEVEKITGDPGRTFARWAVDHADLYR
ncbi:NAD(P)H-binding protein [Actinomadura sp. HBU206391]|uniref:NAD(P)H-binding protein n=1 Tax=Actinomadura sp. HBU206391 TaxID=2731692 RepID=UPI00164FBEED|nr:NAD(P)H-binding protein [Actinomadura sp. HBU206391]MBC6459533.1 NAD(P)H-binding protein [Actinomadura sp. HBU206391]